MAVNPLRKTSSDEGTVQVGNFTFYDLGWPWLTSSDLEKEDDFPMTGPAPCTLRRILFLFLTIGVPYLLICGYFYFLAEEDLDELIQAKWNICGSGLGLVWVWFGSGLGLVWVWSDWLELSLGQVWAYRQKNSFLK